MSRLTAIICLLVSLSACTANLKATDLDGSLSLTKKGDYDEKTEKTTPTPVQAQLYQKCCTGTPKKYA